MKVLAVRRHKIRVLRRERRSRGHHHVTRYFPEIKVAHEEVVRVVRPKYARAIRDRPARRRCAHVRHDRHQVARARVPGRARVFFAVNATVNRVNQPVAFPRRADLKKRPAQHPLARRGKRHPHRVVHAAREHRLEPRPVRSRPKDVRRPRHKGLPVSQRVPLLGEGAFRPIEPTLRPEIRPVQIVRTPRQRLAVIPLLPSVRHAVAIRIGEFPNVRRRSHVE